MSASDINGDIAQQLQQELDRLPITTLGILVLLADQASPEGRSW